MGLIIHKEHWDLHAKFKVKLRNNKVFDDEGNKDKISWYIRVVTTYHRTETHQKSLVFISLHFTKSRSNFRHWHSRIDI